MNLEQKIRALTEQGKSQLYICKRLRLSRATVYRLQKQLGLCLPKYGPRKPVLLPDDEMRVLALLASGLGTARIATRLGLSQYAVRKFAEEQGFHRRPALWRTLDPVTREKILQEIRTRQNFGIDLAEKFEIPYKVILKIAHEHLACVKFRPGRAAEPFSSNFPQRYHDHYLGANDGE